MKRILTVVCAAALLIVAMPVAWAQAAYPNKPITMIVPFPAGGLTDVLGRLIAVELGKSLGQTVVVDNRAGAGGNVGMQQLVKSAPDGYTISMIITSHAINMSLNRNSGYDVQRDLAPIRLLVMSTNVLTVHPSVPARTVQELIDLQRNRKYPLSFSSSGNGTTPHLSGELFKNMAGIEMTHVPYKGAAPAINDLLGGQVQLGFNSVSEQLQNIRSGKLRALGVTSARRSPLLPDVPAIAETPGMQKYEINGWLGVVAPAGTPPAVIELLSNRIGEILRRPDIRERFETSMAITAVDEGPESFRRFIAAEVERWRTVVKLANATVD
jgi:tripartite-type tricarboxylate transporter receptor subunit TctC